MYLHASHNIMMGYYSMQIQAFITGPPLQLIKLFEVTDRDSRDGLCTCKCHISRLMVDCLSACQNVLVMKNSQFLRILNILNNYG